MGEAGKDALRVGFDLAIKLEFHGARISSDVGLLPYRDLDNAAGLTDSAAAELLDLRTGDNIQHNMAPLSSGSRRASTPCVGCGYRATASTPIKCGYSCTCWHTI